MSNKSKRKKTVEVPTQFVWVEENEEVCLNCQYFRQYSRAKEQGGEHIPINKGWCQFHRCDQPATRPPCTYRRMKNDESRPA